MISPDGHAPLQIPEQGTLVSAPSQGQGVAQRDSLQQEIK